MTGLPRWARRSCDHCGADVAYAQTTRKSKGVWVEIMIDFAPDQAAAGTVPVQVSREILYGNPVPKSQAAAMRNAGKPLHTLHKETCLKRNTSHRT